MTDVPALPQRWPRSWRRAPARSTRLGARLCRERGALPATRLAVTDAAAGFSSDGFHASEAGYRAWAEHLLPFVLGEREPAELNRD